jgi:hypothetical protein
LTTLLSFSASLPAISTLQQPRKPDFFPLNQSIPSEKAPSLPTVASPQPNPDFVNRLPRGHHLAISISTPAPRFPSTCISSNTPSTYLYITPPKHTAAPCVKRCPPINAPTYLTCSLFLLLLYYTAQLHPSFTYTPRRRQTSQ